MREARVPEAGQSPLQRSVVACLASLLELDTADVPLPPADHPEPWTVWAQWLAQRGLGLVPVLEPAAFDWPGPWIALLNSEDGPVAAVAYGAPPGLAWTPLPGPATFAAVERGFVIAPADVALWAPAAGAAARTEGQVDAIAVAPEAERPMIGVEGARAAAGRGLEGDRYFEGRGTFSNASGCGYDLTLIEAEALEALETPPGPLTLEDARRNILTRGIDLNALVGRRFTVGPVECFGQRLCEPCAHLQRLAGRPGTLRALVHRGGLRADVVSGGTIRVGDAVRPSAA
jgi:hypothetical protein